MKLEVNVEVTSSASTSLCLALAKYLTKTCAQYLTSCNSLLIVAQGLSFLTFSANFQNFWQWMFNALDIGCNACAFLTEYW